VIELQTSVDEKSGTPLAVAFLPGIPIMALLFMSQSLAEDFWRERQTGTLRRAAGTPSGILPWMVGKVLAGMVLVAAVTLVILGIGMPALSLPWSAVPLALAWSVIVGAVFIALMALIQTHASSRRAASLLSSSIIFPLLMLGGSFFPAEVMPGWMAAVGRWTPNGRAVEVLNKILLGRADPLVVISTLAVLLPAGLLALLLCARRIRRVFTVS
jgi:ABC-type multidrug transport system permease subunit